MQPARLAGCAGAMSDEAPEEPFEEAASSPYLFVDGEVNSDFELQIFTADLATGSPAFPLLLIAEFEGKSLVAVPSQALGTAVPIAAKWAYQVLFPSRLQSKYLQQN